MGDVKLKGYFSVVMETRGDKRREIPCHCFGTASSPRSLPSGGLARRDRGRPSCRGGLAHVGIVGCDWTLLPAAISVYILCYTAKTPTPDKNVRKQARCLSQSGVKIVMMMLQGGVELNFTEF